MEPIVKEPVKKEMIRIVSNVNRPVDIYFTEGALRLNAEGEIHVEKEKIEQDKLAKAQINTLKEDRVLVVFGL